MIILVSLTRLPTQIILGDSFVHIISGHAELLKKKVVYTFRKRSVLESGTTGMHHNRACIFKHLYIHGLYFFCKTDKHMDKKQDGG